MSRHRNRRRTTKNDSTAANPPSPVLLFGHIARNRILLELSVRGPLSGGELARLVRINRSHASSILRDFRSMGLIARECGQRSKAALNEAFFAFSELVTLLHALGGRRVLACAIRKRPPLLLPAPS